MSTAMMQGLVLVLLTVIVVLLGFGVIQLLRTVAALGRQHEEMYKVLAGRDAGPALHSLVQQMHDVNRQLANIDKRLEKLEALEKVQIASLSFRDDPRSNR